MKPSLLLIFSFGNHLVFCDMLRICYVLYFKAWQLHVRKFGQSIVPGILFCWWQQAGVFPSQFLTKTSKAASEILLVHNCIELSLIKDQAQPWSWICSEIIAKTTMLVITMLQAIRGRKCWAIIGDLKLCWKTEYSEKMAVICKKFEKWWLPVRHRFRHPIS